MSNTAALGLTIETSGVKAGIRDLSELSTAAAKTEKSAEAMGKSVEAAGARAASGGKMAQQMLAAMERLEKVMRDVERSVSPLNATMKQAGASMTENARASTLAAAGYDSVSRSSVAANTNLRQTAQAARQAKDDLGAMARAATSTSAVMDRINRATGVSSVGGGSREDIAATIQYGRELDALRAKYNPLFAIGQQYKTQVEEIRRAHSVGAIGVHEMEEAIAQAGAAATAQQSAYVRMGSSIAGAGANVKLTSHQVTNLGYQVNDVATMLAMGASPFQVISSQAGQVVQALGDGPGGMMGSLKAIGGSILGLTRFITPLTIGLTAAAGAVAYFALRNNAAENSAASSEKAVAAYTEALKGMRIAAGDAATAAGAIFDRETTLSPAAARAQLQQAVEAQRQARADATEAAISRVVPVTGTIDGLQNVLQRTFSGDYRRFIGQMEDIVSALAAGKMTATEFQDEIAAIRTNPLLPGDLKQVADGLSDDAKSARAAEASVKALTGAVQELGYEAAKITFDKLRGELENLAPKVTTTAQDILRMNNEAIRELGKLDPTRNSASAIEGMGKNIQRTASAAFDELSRSAREAAQDAQAALADVDASPLQRQINQVTREYERQRQEAERTNGSAATLDALRAKSEADVAVLIKENTRAEEARRAGYALDLQAIGARDAATKASIEAERTRIDLLSQGYSAAEAQARASETLSLSLAESAQSEADSLRQRNEARTDALAGLQLEMQTLGKTAGETARLTAEYQLLQEAKRAAYDEGRNVSQDEIAAIQRQAAAVGDLTQALAEQKLQQDILFERSQIGLSDQEQAIRERLKSSGIDIESANGRAFASQIRYNDALQESRDLAKDFTETLVDGLSSGEGVLKSLTSAFAQLGNQMASKGLNMLFDGLMGGGEQQSSAPTVSNAFGALGQGISKLASSPTFQTYAAPTSRANSAPTFQTYAAPTISVERSVLPALTQASSSMSAAAAAIRTIESGSAAGNYSARGPVTASGDRAYGAYQVMGNNIASWSKAALGQSVSIKEFVSNAAIQDKVFQNQFGRYMEKYGPEGASRAWFAGEGGMKNFKAQDVVGTSVGGYGSRFGQLYAQQGGAANDNVLTRSGMTSSVSDGMVSYSQKVAAGGVPGVDAWGGLRQVTGGQPAASSSGGGVVSGASSFLQSPLVQGGLNALSAGAAGYQSGSPVGGALNGALSGFAMGGPIGAVVGGIAGLVGGIFGKKKAEKQAREERDIAAGKAWEQAFPKLLELSDYVDMEEKGSLSKELSDIDAQLVEFRKLAIEQGKEKGHVDAINNVATVTAQAKSYGDRLKSELRSSSGARTADLAAGFGLDTEFEKARNGVKETTKAYQGYIADLKLAFEAPEDNSAAMLQAAADARAELEKQKDVITNGALTQIAALETRSVGRFGWEVPVKSAVTQQSQPNMMTEGQVTDLERQAAEAVELAKASEIIRAARDKAINDAQIAAREGLLKLVSGDAKAQTEVEQALAQSRGAAEALSGALVDLGMSATEAGIAINGALNKRMELLRESFTQSIQDSIDSLDGKSYLADFRDLIEGVETMFSDASLINVDTSLVDTFFAKQAQSMVDSAGLTGEAFDELIAAFPELDGVVHSFVGSLEEVASRIREYEDRYFAAMTDSGSIDGQLSMFDRQAAQERIDAASVTADEMVALEKALGAERGRILLDATASLNDRLFTAMTDSSTEAGALAEFERRAAAERAGSADAGADYIALREKVLAAERGQIIDDFATQAEDAAKQLEEAAKQIKSTIAGMMSTKLDRAKAAQTEAESDLRAAYEQTTAKIEGQIDTLKNLQTGLQAFITSIRLNDDRSPLSGYDQFLEAQKTFRDIQAKAMAGDEDAQAQLVSVSTDYLDEARAYYASSDRYFDAFYEVEGSLKAADAKAGVQITAAQAALDQAKSQVSLLISIDDGVKTIPAAIAALQAAIANTKAVQTQVDAGRYFGVNPERNRMIDTGLQSIGLNYGGNYGFQADGSDPFYQWRSALDAATRSQVEQIINSYIDINRQAGGLIPGFANGGMVGNGIWNKDSVVARYAGGGAIGLAGGEMVISAPKVTAQTYPVLDQINRTGRAPGNDNGALIAEVARLSAKLDRLTAVTAEGSMLVAGKVAEGNGHARAQVGEAKKRNAA